MSEPRPPESPPSGEPCRFGHGRVIPDVRTDVVTWHKAGGRRALREFGTCERCGGRLVRYHPVRSPGDWQRAG